MVEPAAVSKTEQAADTRIVASHKVNAKPLDFSFLKIDNIQSKLSVALLTWYSIDLRKEPQRGGKRKPIPESDDEEESKKVSQ